MSDRWWRRLLPASWPGRLLYVLVFVLLFVGAGLLVDLLRDNPVAGWEIAQDAAVGLGVGALSLWLLAARTRDRAERSRQR